MIRIQVERGELERRYHEAAIDRLAEYEEKNLEELRPTDLLAELGWQAGELELLTAHRGPDERSPMEHSRLERERGEI